MKKKNWGSNGPLWHPGFIVRMQRPERRGCHLLTSGFADDGCGRQLRTSFLNGGSFEHHSYSTTQLGSTRSSEPPCMRRMEISSKNSRQHAPRSAIDPPNKFLVFLPTNLVSNLMELPRLAVFRSAIKCRRASYGFQMGFIWASYMLARMRRQDRACITLALDWQISYASFLRCLR